MLNYKNKQDKTRHCKKMRNKLLYKMMKKIQALILQVPTVPHHQTLLLMRSRTLDPKRKTLNDSM